MKMFIDVRSRKVSDCHRNDETDSDAGGPTQIREFSIFVFLIFHWALQEKIKLYNAMGDESIKKNEKVRITKHNEICDENLFWSTKIIESARIGVL